MHRTAVQDLQGRHGGQVGRRSDRTRNARGTPQDPGYARFVRGSCRRGTLLIMYCIPMLTIWRERSSSASSIAVALRSPNIKYIQASSVGPLLVILAYYLGTCWKRSGLASRSLSTQSLITTVSLRLASHHTYNARSCTVSDWTHIELSKCLPEILSRATNRVFVGLPLCQYL